VYTPYTKDRFESDVKKLGQATNTVFLFLAKPTNGSGSFDKRQYLVIHIGPPSTRFDTEINFNHSSSLFVSKDMKYIFGVTHREYTIFNSDNSNSTLFVITHYLIGLDDIMEKVFMPYKCIYTPTPRSALIKKSIPYIQQFINIFQQKQERAIFLNLFKERIILNSSPITIHLLYRNIDGLQSFHIVSNIQKKE
jgi:hypothetical protein